MYGNLGLNMGGISSYVIFVLPALLFAGFAQMKINSAFSKWSKVPNETGLTGAQVARQILDRNGLESVRIEQVSGNLTDHYDPRTRVLRLSSTVYGGSSIASMSVAAHEVGHAMQHDQGYFPLIFRSKLAPVANLSSKAVWILVILGIMISPFLINVGVALFLTVVLFQLVTLPVEFNASKRALLQLENGIAPQSTWKPAKSVLTAAALTYVAATLVAVGELLRILSMTNRRRR